MNKTLLSFGLLALAGFALASRSGSTSSATPRPGTIGDLKTGSGVSPAPSPGVQPGDLPPPKAKA